MLRLPQLGRKIREITWYIFHYFFFFQILGIFVEPVAKEACNLINPQMEKINTHISVCVYSYELSLAMLKKISTHISVWVYSYGLSLAMLKN